MPTRLSVIAASAAVALALSTGACRKPEPPPTDQPPEPQATELRDAIQAPIEKARAVEDTVLEAAEQQRAAIQAAGG